MPWTTPVNPVSGTVITVAYAVSNILDPIRWLRLMTGNADPPGSNYVLTSDSVSAVTWKQLGAAIVSGGGLGYTPANKAGDTFTGAVTVPYPLSVLPPVSGAAGGTIILANSPTHGNVVIDTFNQTLRLFNAANPSKMMSMSLGTGAVTLSANLNLEALDATTTGRIQGAPPSSGSGYVMDAAASVWRIFNPSNSSFMLSFGLTTNVLQVGSATVITSATISSQSVASAGNANTIANRTPGSGSGQIPINNDVLNGNLVAGALGSGATVFTPGQSAQGNFIPISNGNLNPGLNAQFVGGKAPTASPSAGALPLADAAGKLDAWVTPSGGTGAVIPPGLLCYWETATAPSGWVVDTRWDGNIIAMKGGPFSSTLGQTGGGSTHDHSFNNQHSHSGAALGVGGTIGGPSSTGTGGGTGATFADGSHTHTHTLDVSGSTDAAQSTAQSVGSINHLPPYVSLNLIRKT
jgi:hypothetical protein